MRLPWQRTVPQESGPLPDGKGKRRRTIRLPIQITIFTTFALLVSATAGGVAWNGYVTNEAVAVDAAESLITEVVQKIEVRIQGLYGPLESTVQMMASLTDLATKPNFNGHPLTGAILDVLDANPQITGIYFAFATGHSYHVYGMTGQTGATPEDFDAPAGSRYAVRHIFTGVDQERYTQWRFLGENRRLTGTRLDRGTRYDARNRIWFRMGINSERRVRTPIYAFATGGQFGFTVAKRFDAAVPGVLAADVTLETLSMFLQDQSFAEGGKALTFDQSGVVTAFPDPSAILDGIIDGDGLRRPMRIADMGQPDLNTLFAVSRGLEPDQREIVRVYDNDDRQFIASLSPLETTRGTREYLVAMVPVDDISRSITEVGQEALMYAGFILLGSIPIVLLVARSMSKPLAALSRETQKIQAFDLDSDVKVESWVSEIDRLADAATSMKTGLRSFGRYVPRALVKQILDEEISTDIGGERREVTLLFTDIAAFTTLSEQLNAEELVHMLSDYFQEVSDAILDEEGTIDKYIGDAVMAFWNAPLEQGDHKVRACRAALRAEATVMAQNGRRLQIGQPPLHTRFGVHTGDVIVGNMGCSDRMNYTATGSAVNIAARLEGLNKAYGTSVLISGEVRAALPEGSITRSMDIALPKGATSPIEVVELLSMPGLILPGWTEVDPAAAALRAQIMHPDFLARWEEMIQQFRNRNWQDCDASLEVLWDMAPNDRVVALYRSRVSELLIAPPDEYWTPVAEYQEK